jgi:hypothetical protein
MIIDTQVPVTVPIFVNNIILCFVCVVIYLILVIQTTTTIQTSISSITVTALSFHTDCGTEYNEYDDTDDADIDMFGQPIRYVKSNYC